VNEILSKLRKNIQKGLTSPDSLFWKFDGQERGGEPFRVFLDLNYQGKSVVIEWHSLHPEDFGITLLTNEVVYGSGHDHPINGVEAAARKAVELLNA